MDQYVKVIAIESVDLNSILGTHMMKEENLFTQIVF